ncbi:MAG: SPOR domain-containing protein [Bacteroidales bacterium]
MKKNLMIISVAVLALSATSCKTNQNAYKAAYEKAKEKEVVTTPAENETFEVVEVKRTQTTHAPVQVEKVTGVTESDVAGLKRWNIVVGSFKNKTNAEGLKAQMIEAGYPALLAQNAQGMYRVIVASFNDRESAAEKRSQIREKYAPRFNDIWLLDNQ